MTRYVPELGQAAYGNPYDSIELPEYAEAMLQAIRAEIERVYWNINQKEWSEYDGSPTPVFEWRPYYWGEDDVEAAKPNFKFQDVEVRWYKHLGGDQRSTGKSIQSSGPRSSRLA